MIPVYRLASNVFRSFEEFYCKSFRDRNAVFLCQYLVLVSLDEFVRKDFEEILAGKYTLRFKLRGFVKYDPWALNQSKKGLRATI